MNIKSIYPAIALLAALPLPVFAAKAGAPAGEPSVAFGLAQTIVALLLVLGLIFVFGWFMRRMTRLSSTAPGAIRIVGGASLGPRERVVLLEVGGRQLLLGVAPGRVQTLHVLEQPVATAPAAGRPEAAGGFADRLAQVIRQRGA